MRRIQIYDTTLRDGSQGEGVSFSLQDKLLVTARLDSLGFDFVEGGYPLSNEKDAQYFQRVLEQPPEHARVCAFGLTTLPPLYLDVLAKVASHMDVHLFQLAPWKCRSIAAFRPLWASLVTNCTPLRPRALRSRNNSWYVAALSVSATATARISRYPSARTPATISTPWLTIRPSCRTCS